jgi:hypothetical protein
MTTVEWEYPKQLHDEHGYPTPEAIDYIKNWSITYGFLEHGATEDATKVGKYFSEGEYDRLISYLKELWWYGEDAVEYEDGLLELHTFGWSGNEEIIDELQRTNLWMLKFKAKQTGGHYYFKVDSDSEHDWYIVKSKDK